MAVINPPLALQAAGSNHPSRLLRRAFFGAVSREGVANMNGANDLLVTAGGGFNTSVAKGGAFVKGDILADNGLYFVFNDGAVTLTHAAAHASLARTDIIIARINDNTDEAIAGNTWTLEIVQGANGGGVPATPSSALKIAEVSIPAALGAITSGQITDYRPYVYAVPILSAAPGTSQLLDGQIYSRTDLDALQLAVGANLYTLGAYKIAETILGVDTASITFASIPQNYRHLLLVSQSRATDGAVRGSFRVRFNGDTGANYAQQFIRNFNGAGAGSSDNENTMHVMDIAANTAAAGRAGMAASFVPHYAGTAWHKQMATIGGNFGGATTDWIGSLVNGIWKNTAAITSITILGPTSYFAGSVFSLYGIP